MQSCPGTLIEVARPANPSLTALWYQDPLRSGQGSRMAAAPAKPWAGSQWSALRMSGLWPPPIACGTQPHLSVYLDEAPCSPDMKLAVRRAQTASSIEVGMEEPMSSDSGDESPRGRPSVQKHASCPAAVVVWPVTL